MTIEELLQALADAHVRDEGEGFTVAEMAAASRSTDQAMRRLIRPLVASGRVRVSRKLITALDGRPMRVSSYVFLEEPAGRATFRR